MPTFDQVKREPLLKEAAYLRDIAYLKTRFIDRCAEDFFKHLYPQYTDIKALSWQWCRRTLELVIELYSGGEPIDSLPFYAEHLFTQLKRHKHDFPEFSLKLWEPADYELALWLLSLAVMLDLPHRVEELAGYVCLDPKNARGFLLLQLFAQAGVPFAEPCPVEEKPYTHLNRALHTQGAEQQQAVRNYLKHWYHDKHDRYWFDLHKRRNNDTTFFGYWAFEAGLVALLQGIDDSSFRKLPHYPRALVDHARHRQNTATPLQL